MHDAREDRPSEGQDVFAFDLPDEALEAAAAMSSRAAVSFPAAPTVSILVLCCGND